MAHQENKTAPLSGHAGGPPPSPWMALRYPVFRLLWIATVVSNVGGWMYSAACGWLMTSLDPDPFVVSLVQVANSLPLFLFALPAGAIADMTDKRRFILVLEVLTSVFSALFGLLVVLKVVTPTVLLLFTFLTSILAAVEMPAWQAIVPQLVPQPALSSAIATNSVGVNISRVIGPALAGVVILTFGIAAPFWLDAVSNVGVIGVILWWRSPERRKHVLPPERLASAVRAGVRYARNNRQLRATIFRAIGFFLFASAYWALLPTLARTQLHGGPTLYGVLLGAIGAGAVAGAFVLPKIRAHSGANRLIMLAEAAGAAALLLYAFAQQPLLAVLASLLAGVSWIAVLATLNVSAQVALPDWVRARGLAVYVTVFFGTMSAGSALWGLVAARFGLPAALSAAAAGSVIALFATRRWKLHTGPAADLTPSMHWPEPVLAGPVPQDAGPVLVTVEYRVAPADRHEFLTALAPLAHERRRDGAYDWRVFSDVAHPERIIETFLLDSWLEHLRQHQRVTNADRVMQDRLARLTREPPRVTHYVAAQQDLTVPKPG
jgi:MFS family permease